MKKLLDKAIALRNSLNTKTDQRFVRERDMGEQIPKIIHQTYFQSPSDPDFPAELKANIGALKCLNPSWDYRFYTDDDIERYIAIHFPELIELYHKIDPRYGAARADFFRYLVIYNEGGVYLDVKSGASKPLDELLQDSDKIVLSHWPRSWPKIMLGQHPGISNPIGELQQWYIISVAGHPFLESVINNVCNNISHYNPVLHDYGSWGVFNLTGPIAFTEAIYPLLDHYLHRLEDDHLRVGLTYCAIGPENSTGGHHLVFSRKHYSKIQAPIVKVPFYLQALFCVSKPSIKILKILYNIRTIATG
ncbi:Glycosyltransferase sugar-binding region containing DXD motif protein [Roseovarius albus]|uniref:Glycosyltransferase sugar-binding region containing DXD motif protein n=1 Tax=Roseovarius albus TaxID=1247867 RepID=A0A1X6Y747_9RHOB|nr:glycosyltransferase [Roseovarius albus]SLN11960.1 Glycosyltransferase sugar-binding region containing DXD motif protein [Roseovarius albus]